MGQVITEKGEMQRCFECGSFLEPSTKCGHCRSRKYLVELAWQLSVAAEKAKIAYGAHPSGAWGSMVSHLKCQIDQLAHEVAKQAGVLP